MTTTCGSTDFGLNPQALAVLTLLSHRAPDFADYNDQLGNWDVTIKTFPWYQGRERGVAFVVTHRFSSSPGQIALCITVGECASSDAIFVDEWEQDMVWVYDNGPTPERRREQLGEVGEQDINDGRWSCGEGQIGKAADRIYSRMARWYKAQKLINKAQLKAVKGGKA